MEGITLQGIQSAVRKKDKIISALEKYHDKKTNDLFDAWSNTWTSPLFTSFDIQAQLSTIKAPILLVQSADDAYGSMNQIQWIMKNTDSKIKDTLILENAGHAPHLNSREVFLESLTGFLSLT
jgi:pimeloyl-ACP methyl ester carboxylesterase